MPSSYVSNGFISRSNNIDAMVSALDDVKKSNGQESSVTLAKFHPSTNERMNKFQRVKYELDPKNKQALVQAETEKKKEDSSMISNIERGVFVYDKNDTIEMDTSLPYVCEYCTNIDYTNAYRADICDLCDVCEQCVEFRNGSCDGCEYSVAYNGTTYGEKTGHEGSTNESSELEELRTYDPEVKMKSKFTIMDY